MTRALDALLKEVEAVEHRAFPITGPYIAAAPRLAAMLRVAVEALGVTQRDVWSVVQHPAVAIGIESIARHALARIEAMAKGEE